MVSLLKLKWPPRCDKPRKTLIVPRRPLEKAFLFGLSQIHYSKNSFYGQKQIQKSQEITNLFLASREARVSAPSGNDFPLKTHWAALGAAREKVGKITESQIMEYIYDSARTYFIKNS